MSALALLWVLAQPVGFAAGGHPRLAEAPTAPVVWLERDGARVRLTADATPLFDGALHRRLISGLTVTLHLRAVLREHSGGAVRGVWWRGARIRWDLWDEKMSAVVNDAEGHAVIELPSAEAFIQRFGRAQRALLVDALPRDDTVYRVDLELDVNPIGPEHLAVMRRWLALPGSDTALEPVGRATMGSFVRLFDNLRPGGAERELRASGHPVRGDRLPFVTGPSHRLPTPPPGDPSAPAAQDD